MSELMPQLQILESSGLVSLSSLEPDLTYAFRHPLMQEVAYRSLTREDRKNLHWTIGSTLEMTYPDRLDEIAPILGDHFDHAGDEKRALHYYQIAGHAAQRVYANPEAAMYYRKALRIVLEGKEKPAAGEPVLMDLCGDLGRVLELSGQHVDALRHYQEMEDLAQQIGDRPLELGALLARITLLSTPTFVLDPERALELSRRALDLAQELGDRPAEAKIYWNMLLALTFSSEIQKAKEYGEKSLELARALNLREQLAYTLNDIAHVYVSTGELDRALQILEEVRTIWQEIENYPMLTDSINQAASIYLMQGKIQTGTDLADEAYRISKEIGNLWGQSDSRVVYSVLYTHAGLGDQALASIEETIRLGEGAGFAGALVIGDALRGYLYTNFGAYDDAALCIDEAIRIGETISNFWVDQAYGCLALLNTVQGKLSEADEAIRQANQVSRMPEVYLTTNFVTTAECELRLKRGNYSGLFDYTSDYMEALHAYGAKAFLPDCLFYRGYAHLGLGRVEEARSTLKQAETEGRSLGLHRVHWRTLALLAELELQQGNRKAGLAWLKKAQKEVAFIAGHAGSDTLRASFLSMDSVRRLGELVS